MARALVRTKRRRDKFLLVILFNFCTRSVGALYERPFSSNLQKGKPTSRASPSPAGRGWREAPGEGSNAETVCCAPSSGASRHLLPEGEGPASTVRLLFWTALCHRPPLQKVSSPSAVTSSISKNRVTAMAVLPGEVRINSAKVPRSNTKNSQLCFERIFCRSIERPNK